MKLFDLQRCEGKSPPFFLVCVLQYDTVNVPGMLSGYFWLNWTHISSFDFVFIFLRVGVSLAKYFSIICISWMLTQANATSIIHVIMSGKNIPQLETQIDSQNKLTAAQKMARWLKCSRELFTREFSCPINYWKSKSDIRPFRRMFVYIQPLFQGLALASDNKNNLWKWRKRIFMTFLRNEKMFRPLNRNWDFSLDSIFVHPPWNDRMSLKVR